MAAKASLQSRSTCSTVASCEARILRLKLTLPATVFVEPGLEVDIPVLASAPFLDAALQDHHARGKHCVRTVSE